MSCAICGRASPGFGFSPPGWGNERAPLAACSMICLDILAREGRNMFKLNHYETPAIDAASDAAGEYLERIGKSDLATMSQDEWRELLKTVFVRSTATIQRLTDEGAVPF